MQASALRRSSQHRVVTICAHSMHPSSGQACTHTEVTRLVVQFTPAHGAVALQGSLPAAQLARALEDPAIEALSASMPSASGDAAAAGGSAAAGGAAASCPRTTGGGAVASRSSSRAAGTSPLLRPRHIDAGSLYGLGAA